MSEGTKVLKCLCEHEDQDRMYGKGMRVHNRLDNKDSKKDPQYVCTVCTPRSLPCERNATAIDPAPMFGMNVRIPARKLRVPKKG